MERNLSFDIYEDNVFITHVNYDLNIGGVISNPTEASWLIPNHPSWNDIVFFLESRIMTKRNDYKKDLELLGLNKWNIFDIIKSTHGKLASDKIELRNLSGF